MAQDLKSSPLPNELLESSMTACEQAASAIRTAHEHLSPEEAVETIGDVWEQLEKTSQLAEATMRICLGKLPEPKLADSPDWLRAQLPNLSEGEPGLAASHPLAIDAAERIIRACLHSSSAQFQAGVQKAPLGHVLVDWDVTPHALQWEIEAARLPWPGVKVNALVVDNSQTRPQVHSRILHTAFEVVEHFHEQLHELGIETGVP